jgi:hypothetical protein
VVAVVVLSGGAAAPVRAQVDIGRNVPHAGSIELSAGVAYSAGYDLDSVSAEETRNTGSGTGPFVLFSATSRADPAAGLQGRVGVYLAPSVSVEGGVLFARPMISSLLTDDAESAPEVTATETLTRLVFNGSLVLHLTGMSFADGRAVPFVLGGGGVIRELHEKNEVVETGHEYHAGAGLHVWFGAGKRRAGIRGDVGIVRRSGGAYADVSRTVPMAAGSVAFLF